MNTAGAPEALGSRRVMSDGDRLISIREKNEKLNNVSRERHPRN